MPQGEYPQQQYPGQFAGLFPPAFGELGDWWNRFNQQSNLAAAQFGGEAIGRINQGLQPGVDLLQVLFQTPQGQEMMFRMADRLGLGYLRPQYGQQQPGILPPQPQPQSNPAGANRFFMSEHPLQPGQQQQGFPGSVGMMGIAPGEPAPGAGGAGPRGKLRAQQPPRQPRQSLLPTTPTAPPVPRSQRPPQSPRQKPTPTARKI